jgi:hypothetical protein
MTTPLATIFEGDVTLEQGSDVTQFGWGDLTVNRKCIINSTENSTGAPSSGALLVNGGMLVGGNANIQQTLNVLYGRTNLTETHIDTTNAPTTITGGNGVSISVGGASQFVSSGGNLLLSSLSGQLQLFSGSNNNYNAINIVATNSGGSVSIGGGSGSGSINLTTGSGGINAATSRGNVKITANNGSGSVVVNSGASNQNLTLGLVGNTDSSIVIDSAGTNVNNTALVINTSNTNGALRISNANGLGVGNISLKTGSGGYSLITNTGGGISTTSQGAGTSILVSSNGNNQNLLLSLQGSTDSSLSLISAGVNSSNPAINILTTNTNGSIIIGQTPNSNGQTAINAGKGGFNVNTQTGGSISLTSYGAVSNYTNATTADNQDLIVRVSGNTNSRVVIDSSGTGFDAIKLQTTNGTGGVLVSSVGTVALQSSNTNLGVQIATNTPGVPITIGTPSGVTTIFGDLYVKGNTSTVNHQVVAVDDNILALNSAPYGTSDGGYAVKRYQPANDTGSGDVVIDTADESGQVQNNGNTSSTVHLDMSASNVDNHYNGWWIRLTGGTGAGQVRKIKSYNGTSRIATIYTTSDQKALLGNPQPIEGLDFVTIPDTTTQYALFPCHYVMNIWDESANEFAFVCSTTNPSQDNSFQPSITHYSDLHVNDLISSAVFADTINNSAADLTTYVTLTDNDSSPTPIPGLPNNYGIYLLFVKPSTSTIRASAIFMIGRINIDTTPGTFVRMMSVKGAQNEQLGIQWRGGAAPEIYYRPNPGVVGNTTYKIKVVSL